ncbi:MAG: glycosyltransferase family 4 protein [Chthoniobacteraceae bacterium]
MRIAFGDFSGWDFHAQSVDSAPLGGSQSAACYLAQALAREGHEVFLLTHTSAPGKHAGVGCLSWPATPLDSLRALRLDVFVCILAAGNGEVLRAALGPETRLVLWTQHRFDQESVQRLADAGERGSYDAFALVSDWQRKEFVAHFSLPPDRTRVLRNAVAPAFLDLFADDQPIVFHKAQPPLLAYTSTPFRGLDRLLDAFPAIREAVPGARLRVFSSMAVYRTPQVVDHLQHGALYQRCRETPGIEYIGSIPQPALARELRGVTALAYPNTFPETSCISALEAMAGGCLVVTSALGALPETTAGFAHLVPFEQSRESYLREFVERTVVALRGESDAVDLLRRQVRHIRENSTWELRAREWSDWLDA